MYLINQFAMQRTTLIRRLKAATSQEDRRLYKNRLDRINQSIQYLSKLEKERACKAHKKEIGTS